MVHIQEWQECEEVLVTLDAKGRLKGHSRQGGKGALRGGHQLGEAYCAPPKSKSSHATEVDGTGVCESGHDAVDPDIRADVERELGNEAFRKRVRKITIGLKATRFCETATCSHIRKPLMQDYTTAAVHYTSALAAIVGLNGTASDRTRLKVLLNRAQ
eukprot:1776597-Pyramimonas_sp.AAC.1